jgi:hypothetical protein
LVQLGLRVFRGPRVLLALPERLVLRVRLVRLGLLARKVLWVRRGRPVRRALRGR